MPFEAHGKEPENGSPSANHEAPPKADDLGFALPEPARITRGRAVLLGGAAVLVLGGAFAVGLLPRLRDKQALEAETKSSGDQALRVEIVAPKESTSDRSLSLPGSILALEETVVYPQASGYVRKWHKDLGDKVDEGEVLAEIDTPELDQQIAQARAQLAQADAGILQAKANAAYSKQNFERYQKLVPQGVASQEDLEKAKAQAAVDAASIGVAGANVEAQRANVHRLTQLKTFARVVAPFSGQVTARSVERGALVTAGNGSPLFKVAATDPVRVIVQVPQDVAASVRAGVVANVSVREYPGRTFKGEVARSAGALDAATRTMLTEIRVPNPKGELLAGVYAKVSLSLPTPHRVFAIPATALLNDAKGLRVAIVGPGDTIHLVPVVVERDTGPTVEIASGLKGNERVVKLAGTELKEGRTVTVAR